MRLLVKSGGRSPDSTKRSGFEKSRDNIHFHKCRFSFQIRVSF